MNEKELTDEEYIKRLEYCQFPMTCCICQYEGDCGLDNSKTVDLIHRLRAEIEQLNAKYRNLEINYNAVWEDFRKYEEAITMLKYTHLQDECRLAEMKSICKRANTLCDEWEMMFTRARKDTAKEIYQQLQGHGTTYVKKWIKEHYGVEVE